MTALRKANAGMGVPAASQNTRRSFNNTRSARPRKKDRCVRPNWAPRYHRVALALRPRRAA